MCLARVKVVQRMCRSNTNLHLFFAGKRWIIGVVEMVTTHEGSHEPHNHIRGSSHCHHYKFTIPNKREVEETSQSGSGTRGPLIETQTLIVWWQPLDLKTLSKLLLAALISVNEKRHKSDGRIVDPGVFVDLVASKVDRPHSTIYSLIHLNFQPSVKYDFEFLPNFNGWVCIRIVKY